MEISSLLTTGVNYQTSKTTTTENNSKVNESTECSEAEKLDAFKKEIWSEINQMPYNRQMNLSIQITDKAFERMIKEPAFKKEILSVLREDACASNKSMASTTLTWIDENGYQGYSYNGGGEEAFDTHSNNKNTFYSKKAVKKKDSTKEWEERALERAYQQKMLDKEYLEGLMNKQLESQRTQIAKLYEQNISFLEGDSSVQ
ncbi:hypothetical protein [Lachnotalea glycerini]|jgi:hypothetical protein|uniref:Uncharacterized protein n=1 Tax=Lachnotalea glycerini TaxID=1763509 RepID=A0A371J923_9FIRM|nr:hypothetical protein [Lachnotalea glycerini]RDY29280.1 hypothetical protein CG710_018620 [Lachnotalea glycerini]